MVEYGASLMLRIKNVDWAVDMIIQYQLYHLRKYYGS